MHLQIFFRLTYIVFLELWAEAKATYLLLWEKQMQYIMINLKTKWTPKAGAWVQIPSCKMSELQRAW